MGCKYGKRENLIRRWKYGKRQVCWIKRTFSCICEQGEVWINTLGSRNDQIKSDAYSILTTLLAVGEDAKVKGRVSSVRYLNCFPSRWPCKCVCSVWRSISFRHAPPKGWFARWNIFPYFFYYPTPRKPACSRIMHNHYTRSICGCCFRVMKICWNYDSSIHTHCSISPSPAALVCSWLGREGKVWYRFCLIQL